MKKNELIYKLEEKLKTHNEQKMLTILIQNVKKKNYVFYAYLGKHDLEVKFSAFSIKDEDIFLQEPKNIFFGRGKGTVLNMVMEITCFDLFSGIPSNDDEEHKSFSISFADQLHIISFGEKCENIEYKPIYHFVNYLLSYIKIEKKYLFEVPDSAEENIIDQALELDNEIILFMKKFESGKKFSLEKKLNEEWKKTDFNERCNKICSKMSNIELIETIYETEYVYDIGNCLERLHLIEVDFNYIREFQEALFGAFIKCVRFKNLILSIGFSDYFLEKIFEKTKVDETIDKILNMMSNEQIMYFYNRASDWNNKFEYMKYLKKELTIEHKIQDYNFRDIDRKLVIVKSMEETFNNFGIKELKNPFIGYVYIDPSSGFNIRVVGNEDNKKLVKELCTEKCFLIRNDRFKYYDIQLFDKNLDTYELQKQMEDYYRPNFVDMRKHEELDSLRKSLYPDDVQVTIPFNDKNEIVWGRLLDYDSDKKYYIIGLLNSSRIEEELKAGTIIACSLQAMKDDSSILVIEAIVSKK